MTTRRPLPRRRRGATWLLVGALALAPIACGDDDDGSSTDTSAEVDELPPVETTLDPRNPRSQAPPTTARGTRRPDPGNDIGDDEPADDEPVDEEPPPDDEPLPTTMPLPQ